MIFAYICLPYSAPTAEGIAENKRLARELAARINLIPDWRAMVPHNLSEGIEGTLPESEWLAFDIEIMRRAADVLVYDRDRSKSRGCLGERGDFRGPQLDQEYVEEFAAAHARGLIGQALRRGRC